MPDTPPPTPTTATVTAGQVLAGRYRLTRPLARGGMAEVWEATDEVLARQVAVKVLLPHLAADAAFVERFRREAVSAARLSHPNVVAVYDTFRDDGVEGIVMELVRGATLRRALDDHGALPVSRAVSVATSVADALEHAHRMRLVHRDVKPGNILIAESGRVVVTDFGIAKAAQDSGDARSDLTDTGTVLGTVKYLSPEQVEGRDVDARSDVYALGCVLYEMLCGCPPFDGGSQMATAVARLRQEPMLVRQRRPGVPRRLEEVVGRALARDPGRRYPTAGELATALRSLEVAPDDDATVTGFPADDATSAVGGDRTPPGGVAVEPRFSQTERTWIVPATLIVVVAVALGIAGLLLGRTEVGRDLLDTAREAVTGDRRPAGAPPEIAAIDSFDPMGSGGEHDGELPNLVDRDPGTTWSTEGYDSRDFGGLKSGVGVVLALEAPARLASLDVLSRTTGWAAEVYVADRRAGTIEAWGEPVATATGLGERHSFDLDGRTGGFVLLWITDLGDGPPRLSAVLAEVTLEG